MVDEGLHDPEDSQTEAWQLHQDEGEEALRCDLEADVIRIHRLIRTMDVVVIRRGRYFSPRCSPPGTSYRAVSCERDRHGCAGASEGAGDGGAAVALAKGAVGHYHIVMS